MTHRAVIGHIFKLLPVLDGHTTTCLLFVQKGFDQQGCGQNFVARAVQQIGAGHVRGAHGFAFAAAQAVFDAVGNGANVRLLHDERLVPHQTKTGGVGVGQVGLNFHALWTRHMTHQFAFVEAAFGIDALLVISKRLEFGVA